MPSNCTIISWKGKKEMASLLKGSKGGAFQYSRRGLRLRRRGAYGIHRASGPMDAKGCVERLHRFAQGAADWRSGPRWTILSVLCPVHPFPLRGNSPQGETRDMKRKTGESYASCTTPAFPPLVANATTFPPQAGALWVLSHGAMSLQESIERPILPPA